MRALLLLGAGVDGSPASQQLETLMQRRRDVRPTQWKGCHGNAPCLLVGNQHWRQSQTLLTLSRAKSRVVQVIYPCCSRCRAAICKSLPVKPLLRSLSMTIHHVRILAADMVHGRARGAVAERAWPVLRDESRDDAASPREARTAGGGRLRCEAGEKLPGGPPHGSFPTTTREVAWCYSSWCPVEGWRNCDVLLKSGDLCRQRWR